MTTRRIIVQVLAAGLLITGFCVATALRAEDKKPGKTAAKGGVYGIVTAKTDKDLMFKAEGESEAKRYLFAPAGGTPKADVQAALKMVFTTNLVVLKAHGDDDPVLTSIQAIHSPTRFGTAAGTVVAVEADAKMPSIDVKPSGRGNTERYVARWDPAVKGWDKNLVQVISGLHAGDKVKIAWTYDERKRAAQIQVVSRAKKAAAVKKKETAPESSLAPESDK